jgi:hypothetical protein
MATGGTARVQRGPAPRDLVNGLERALDIEIAAVLREAQDGRGGTSVRGSRGRAEGQDGEGWTYSYAVDRWPADWGQPQVLVRVDGLPGPALPGEVLSTTERVHLRLGQRLPDPVPSITVHEDGTSALRVLRERLSEVGREGSPADGRRCALTVGRGRPRVGSERRCPSWSTARRSSA